MENEKRVRSAGGVVYLVEDREVKILLIKDKYYFWTLPKGQIEKGENSLKAAIREIKEETSIDDLNYIEKVKDISYYYEKGNKKIQKSVTFYLFKSERKDIDKSKIEEKEANYFSLVRAFKIVGYDNIKRVIQESFKIIKKYEKF
jgi:8-oxo-dGTP pyrophosphatase MutT (NUDIX family)